MVLGSGMEMCLAVQDDTLERGHLEGAVGGADLVKGNRIRVFDMVIVEFLEGRDAAQNDAVPHPFFRHLLFDQFMDTVPPVSADDQDAAESLCCKMISDRFHSDFLR